MPLPANDSLVSYPDGTTSGRATVLSVTFGDDQAYLLTDETPFHPVDPRWPDQGPDRGHLTFGGQSAAVIDAAVIDAAVIDVPVIDCVVGATDGRQLFVGEAIPVRRGEPGWSFVVVHVLAGGPAVGRWPGEGAEVELTVDAAYRLQLSAGHTGCHVASLALNRSLADRWRKAVAVDGLGQPNFDQLAIVSSRIEPDGAVDSYRIGKSLRKKGFEMSGLTAGLPAIAEAANSVLAGWVASAAPVEVRVTGPRLTDLREWVCALPEGTVRIPCGGTHLRSLADVSQIRIGLTFNEVAGELVMTTSVSRLGTSAEVAPRGEIAAARTLGAH